MKKNTQKLKLPLEITDTVALLKKQIYDINHTMEQATDLGIRVDITPVTVDAADGGKLRQLSLNCVLLVGSLHADGNRHSKTTGGVSPTEGNK